MVVQAVIGGLSVLYKLAPGWVMTHYVVSMLILIAAFALWWRSRLEPEEISEVRSDKRLVVAVQAAVRVGDGDHRARARPPPRPVPTPARPAPASWCTGWTSGAAARWPT